MDPIRFSMKHLLLAFLLVSYLLAAFCRGSLLMGTGGGIIYTLAAGLIAMLFMRSLSESPIRRVPLVILTLFAIPVSLAFAFPTLVDRDFEYTIRRHSVERHARAELSELFATDPAFGDLTITARHRKGISVEISGTVVTRADLERLQRRVMSECEFHEQCFVHWRIRILEDSKSYTGMGEQQLTAM